MNSFRLTRGEYWILNLVIQHRYPLDLLAASNAREIFNKAGHGLSGDELLNTLDSMFERQWIEAHIPFVDGEGSSDSIPMNRKLLAEALSDARPAFKHGRGLYYSLTPLGASVWEAFAQPDWDRFLDPGCVGQEAGDPCEITAASEWRVRQYFSHIHLEGTSVVSESVQWDVIRHWQCTYWKTLPQGHRVRFIVQNDHIPMSIHPDPRVGAHRESTNFLLLKNWHEWS